MSAAAAAADAAAAAAAASLNRQEKFSLNEHLTKPQRARECDIEGAARPQIVGLAPGLVLKLELELELSSSMLHQAMAGANLDIDQVLILTHVCPEIQASLPPPHAGAGPHASAQTRGKLMETCHHLHLRAPQTASRAKECRKNWSSDRDVTDEWAGEAGKKRGKQNSTNESADRSESE
ncbi:GL10873 [Drosophila persimilis]|uniref:GL10873 n=1 Tax=Drosophila persimilis TaxID=7234 RepID=B4GDC7_DROPE|nr:GL10873 [Drosophila persimilis]